MKKSILCLWLTMHNPCWQSRRSATKSTFWIQGSTSPSGINITSHWHLSHIWFAYRVLPSNPGPRRRLIREEDFEEILVPELCNLHGANTFISAQLWLKTITLPTILFRTTRLLVVEELRQLISRDTGLGAVEVTDGKSTSWINRVADVYIADRHLSRQIDVVDNNLAKFIRLDVLVLNASHACRFWVGANVRHGLFLTHWTRCQGWIGT